MMISKVVSSTTVDHTEVEVVRVNGASASSTSGISIPDSSSFKRVNAPKATSQSADYRPETVNYLAYGSNMCSKIFLGRRGIRPLSQINVRVPSLRLTFGLPGLPYLEPCFANVVLIEEEPEEEYVSEGNKWSGELIGVVYKITYQDYRQIMRTEGGGSGYQEIEVKCLPISPLRSELEDSLPTTTAPKELFARTLCASEQSGVHRAGRGVNGDCIDKLLARPARPEPGTSQASARYLNLLKTGAREHGLPQYYQDYLASLEPYTMTSWSQKVGMTISILSCGPLFILATQIGALLADTDGKFPRPVSTFLSTMMNLVWRAHDGILKPLFGDGEKTHKRQ